MSVAESRYVRPFVTPEGVDLRLQVATGGERAVAFMIDVLIIGAAMVALTLLAIGVALGTGEGRDLAMQTVAIVWLSGAFVLRNFYFTGFELRPGAATPGKRMQGLRVIARNGGRLTADAVFVRNAMRELEIFLPLNLILSTRFENGLIDTFGLIWAGFFLFFMLFNRDRLRAGDLIAGTMVVVARKRKLRSELVQDAGAPGFAFTQAQVDAYGVKELHVLEDVLRRNDPKVARSVADRIRGKIGWITGANETDAAFLAAYYAALRGRLEQRMLFGHRRADKNDRT